MHLRNVALGRELYAFWMVQRGARTDAERVSSTTVNGAANATLACGGRLISGVL